MINIIRRYFKIKKLQYVKIDYTNYCGYLKSKLINLDQLRFIDCGVSYDKESMCYVPELFFQFRKEQPIFNCWHELGQYISPDYSQAIDSAKFQKHIIKLKQWKYYKAKYYDM